MWFNSFTIFLNWQQTHFSVVFFSYHISKWTQYLQIITTLILEALFFYWVSSLNKNNYSIHLITMHKEKYTQVKRKWTGPQMGCEKSVQPQQEGNKGTLILCKHFIIHKTGFSSLSTNCKMVVSRIKKDFFFFFRCIISCLLCKAIIYGKQNWWTKSSIMYM